MTISRKSQAPKLSDADLAALYAAPESESIEETVEESAARAASEDDQDRFERLLVAHRIDEALLKALAFAMMLTRKDEPRAKELQRRALTRLWERRASWDPAKVKLATFLCGLVRSENSHDAEKAETRRKYEEEAVAKTVPLERTHAPSPEDLVLELEEADEDRRKALGKLEPLRVAFVEAGDKVNLLWLKSSLEGLETPAEMAERTGIPVRQFYLAADRRKRHVERLLAERRLPKGRGEPGATKTAPKDEENG